MVKNSDSLSSQTNLFTKKDLTTRLQKGGALLSDMRQMVLFWSDDMMNADPIPRLARTLPKTTVARVRDTFTRAFRPRFIMGSPPNAWQLAQALENLNCDVQIIRPFYFWITARAEKPLYEFVSDVVYMRARSIEKEIRIEEACGWLTQRLNAAGKSWTPTVIKKVARGLLAALRDFGILEGTVRKRVAAVNLPVETFALIAFCLHGLGIGGREMVEHPDWRLFLLNEIGSEHLFLECHQHGWLIFESVGNICRIEFPEVPFKEYAHGVIG